MQPPASLRTWVLLAVGTLTLLTLTPTVQAVPVVEEEDFDDDQAGTLPENDWFTTSSAGYVATDQFVSSPHSFFALTSADTAFRFPTGICGNSNAVFSFKLRIDDLPASSGEAFFFGFSDSTLATASDSNALVGMRILNTGNTAAVANGASTDVFATIPSFTWAADTWYNVQITTIPGHHEAGVGDAYPGPNEQGCLIDGDSNELDGDDDGKVVLTVQPTAGGTQVFARATFTSDIDDATSPTLMDFVAFGQDASGSGVNPWLDDFEFAYDTPEEPGSRFCADAGESDNFGYDYLEGVNFEQGPSHPVGLSGDYYRFQGDSGNSEYLAKAFDPGSTAFSTIFTIEAATEGTHSLFRVAYTTGATTLQAGSAGDGGADQTAASDGQDGGNFDNHVQVRFIEEGNDWRITIQQNIAGTGLTQLLGSVLQGNPNVATAYNFTIDGRGTTGPIATLYTYPGGQEVLSRETGFGAGTEWKDQWFIGKGTDITESATALDNNDDNDNVPSTCVYDLVGTSSVVGSSGGTPNNQVPDDEPGGEDGAATSSLGSFEVPAGWTAAALNGFLGIILMFMIALGTWAIFGRHIVAMVIGATAGFILAMIFQLFELWVLIVVVILSVTTIFLGVWRSLRGGGAPG